MQECFPEMSADVRRKNEKIQKDYTHACSTGLVGYVHTG
jgi:hypothetical protein